MVAVGVEHVVAVLDEDDGVLGVEVSLHSWPAHRSQTYLVVPATDVIVGRSFDGLDCIVCDEANEALDNAVFIGAAFVSTKKIYEAYVRGSDAQEEYLCRVMWPSQRLAHCSPL